MEVMISINKILYVKFEDRKNSIVINYYNTDKEMILNFNNEEDYLNNKKWVQRTIYNNTLDFILVSNFVSNEESR